MSTGLCVALAGATITPSVAAAGPLTLLRVAPDEAPATVLGLDGKDSSANNNLTNALRKAFANRGLSGGEEISLEEMRLTMGCTNDEVSCLADGGKTLGVRRLVFGYLKPSGGGSYQLDIQILDVTSGKLEAQASITVTKGELASGEIDAKAAAIVNELMPADQADSDLPERPDPLPETGPAEPETEDEPPPPKESGIYFGREKPSTPRWKWVGFGSMLGLTVLAGGATIGMGVWLTAKEGGFRAKLIKTAEESLTDANAANDVDPNMSAGVNLCDVANENPDPAQPDKIRNTAVGTVCRDGKAVQTAVPIAGAATAVFGVTTLVFTGLLLIHKRKPAAEAMLRHGVNVGLTPSVEGGLTVGGGLRF